jgi:hypothetical protein
MPTVNSSAIRRISYDRKTKRLLVTFTTGRVYAYDRVPASVYEDFREAPSKGEFFNREIRDRYPTTLIARSGRAPRSSA